MIDVESDGEVKSDELDFTENNAKKLNLVIVVV